ncbi:regulatory protein RecX [Roseateles sp.]|uniref:regulatory protein RecX n=1 Tax=Roseateles sp. TaxID=1971397 RepID=UPI0025D60863|nr:regulatory protein RecX [Roseateles sp.]MBV8037604.1 regulatory protein RecX [Roseateles sp.]
MARAPLSLKARAIGLLAQREHSRLELRRKLLGIARRSRAAAAADAGTDEEAAQDADQAGENAVDALLDALAAEGYLDETRFVESRLHVRAGRFGAQRIQQELAQHGLKLDAEQQAALRATELERAREVWLKRFGPEPARDAAEQARQTRFLLARGFSPELVRRLLRP